MFEIDTELMYLLPEYYRGIADYEQILNAEEEELRRLAVFIYAVYNNFFVQSLDEASATAWEQLLGIASLPDDTLEFRRVRILNRISMKPPFTLPFLYQRLDELIGVGKYEVAVDYDGYTLFIESSAESQSYAIEVAFTVNHIKPAHIVYINRPLVSDELLLSEAIAASNLAYRYRLGTWALGANAFVSRGEEKVYKMANVKSITDSLLGDVTDFVSSDVASARLNESEVITNLTKSVEGNILTITYLVPTTFTAAITKIELLDSNGDALTSAPVYIPATSGIEIKHTIRTEENNE